MSSSFSGGLRTAAGLGFILLASGSCDSQSIYNSQSQQQDTEDVAARIAELQPAVGTYCGSVHMIQSDQDYQANLKLQIVEQNEHSSTSQDPTDTVRVPMLGGNLSFPALANQGQAGYSTLPDLIQATGGYGAVGFTYGDYNPLDKTVNLPFSLPGAAAGSTYGSLVGTLDDSGLAGQWYSQSSQLLGTFTFTLCNSGSGEGT